MFQLLRPHLVSIAYVFVIFASCLPCTFAAYDFRSGIQCIALICCFIWLLTSAIFLQVIDMFLDQWTVDCNLCYSRHRERYLQKLHSSRCRSDIRSIVIYVTLGFVSSKRWMSGLVSLGTGLLRWVYYQTSRDCSQLSNIVINFELQIGIPTIAVSNVNYKNRHQWSWKICSAKTEPLGVWDGL